MALRILPQLKPGMLMIDEVQHLLSGSYRQQRQALNLIKSLGNQLRVPIVALGTPDALQVIRTDPQVQSRFWTFEMTRWREDNELRALLATIETVLPLRRRSGLHDQAILKLLLAHSGGITRDLFRIIIYAAETAVRSGTERIDVDLVEASVRVERRTR
jgi:hypothetical protein